MANEVHLIVVGKLKNKNFEAIEADYLKRINIPKVYIHELKASADNKELEGKEVLKKLTELSVRYSYLLTEWGKEYTSQDFSKLLFSDLETRSKLAFIICGAEGPSEELKNFANAKFSLSKLTFPHKMARILFIEQLYRAITIKNNHPYHN